MKQEQCIRPWYCGEEAHGTSDCCKATTDLFYYMRRSALAILREDQWQQIRAPRLPQAISLNEWLEFMNSEGTWSSLLCSSLPGFLRSQVRQSSASVFCCCFLALLPTPYTWNKHKSQRSPHAKKLWNRPRLLTKRHEIFAPTWQTFITVFFG